MALVVVAGVALLAFQASIGRGSPRGMIYLAFAAALPGALLYRWGRGPVQRAAATRELLEKAYPAKTALEMGHVEQMKTIPQDRPE